MRKCDILFWLLFLPIVLFAQDFLKKDTVSNLAVIKYKVKGNQLNFTPEAPLLNQVSGAPKAFYSYFWEFGDGHYSKKKTPVHIYEKKGNYKVKLWVTNHYDSGKPPATRPQTISISKIFKEGIDIASMSDDFKIQKNREPIPEEKMVVTMSYKNTKNYVTSGKLFFFYNEHKYKDNNFEIINTRTHYNEKKEEEIEAIVYANDVDKQEKLYASLLNEVEEYPIQVLDSTRTDLLKTIEESKNYYKNWSIFNFDQMNSNDERNIFFTLKTTPEMLKDTSAIISIRGVYVPDSSYKNHKVKEMEMEIVTSHDPNKMSSNGTFLNYRLVRFKTLKYKIRFQNDGEGPAKTIRLETDIPRMLDKSTIKVLDMYPKCEICPKKKVNYSCLDTMFTKEQIIFTFRNIYLPGSNQKNIKEKDSTKGFVKYSVKFDKDFHKKKTSSGTAIIFDKNEPIITNRATTRFLPGISIGAKAGYNYYPKLKKSNSYFVGATVSPYRSYRWYWQVEWLNNMHFYDDEIISTEKNIGLQASQGLERISVSKKNESVNWEVPVLVRCNVNNYFGLGAGVQGDFQLYKKQETTILTEHFSDETKAELLSSKIDKNRDTESFGNLSHGYLVEITGGFSRIGPSVGARYVFNQTARENYWQFYAIWKF
ncbi:PKD domain-containing protein [Tenacibaculum sp. Bg11-29]|uniref:PKD domain-containing protein n=1 Tax=Tenacibaculum sp. Bg11-29 TaxID=2058306 RepID=UPI000C340FF0|nr:PKD domain-containing protein [Tenacibaculum sp. Bg11-29]PKH52999.1 PKD domain-containing protein [Tenacibaculum sp. Bg11-29]